MRERKERKKRGGRGGGEIRDGTFSLEYQRVKKKIFRFDLKDRSRRWEWERKWR